MGPTAGGMDITIHGSDFSRKHTCFFGSNEVMALRQEEGTLKFKLPPTTKPGPVYVTIDRETVAVVGSLAVDRPDNAAVFTYDDESPLQEM